MRGWAIVMRAGSRNPYHQGPFDSGGIRAWWIVRGCVIIAKDHPVENIHYTNLPTGPGWLQIQESLSGDGYLMPPQCEVDWYRSFDDFGAWVQSSFSFRIVGFWGMLCSLQVGAHSHLRPEHHFDFDLVP
jgi:hypothetical protein